MTQVSRMPLRKEIEARVYEVLLESIAAARTRQTVGKLLEDLLSPTERLMLAKRLSIALLLIKKYDQRTIARVLKVGLETVSKVSRTLQSNRGGYLAVASSIIHRERLKEVLEKIDDTMADGMPPVGRDWRHWRRQRWEAKIRDKRPF